MVATGLVTNEAQAVAQEVEDQLEARDLRGLGFLALAGATGVIIAQEVTERVLPLLQMPREPSTPTQFGAAGLVKIAFALVVGAIAATQSGFVLVFLAFHAVGAVVFAGADFVNAVQRSGLLAESNRSPSSSTGASAGGGSGNPNAPRPQANGGGSGYFG